MTNDTNLLDFFPEEESLFDYPEKEFKVLDTKELNGCDSPLQINE